VSVLQTIEIHERTFDAFINGRLSKGEWTHEAHLVTCWMTLQTRAPNEALEFLRNAITTHNCGIGIENTAYSGYHETLTVYYVTAVAKAMAAGQAERPEDLYNHHWTDRSAPGRYWSKALLFSIEARTDWVEPDLTALPWSCAATRQPAQNARDSKVEE